MRKRLLIILVVVMLLSLIPMTAWGSTMTYTGNDSVSAYYEYTPVANGTLNSGTVYYIYTEDIGGQRSSEQLNISNGIQGATTDDHGCYKGVYYYYSNNVVTWQLRGITADYSAGESLNVGDSVDKSSFNVKAYYTKTDETDIPDNADSSDDWLVVTLSPSSSYTLSSEIIPSSGQIAVSYAGESVSVVFTDPVATAVDYIERDSFGKATLKVCTNAVAINSKSAISTWAGGTTYVVKENTTIDNRITVNGTVQLILCDGVTLTASKGITLSEGKTLTIYGQIGNSGALTATATSSDYAGIGGTSESKNSGTFIMHGGVVNATGYGKGAGVGGAGGGKGGLVTVYGGVLKATGGTNNQSFGIGDGAMGTGFDIKIGNLMCVFAGKDEENANEVKDSADFLYTHGVSGGYNKRYLRIEQGHTHNFKYDISSSNEAQFTATCDNLDEKCRLTAPLTLTLKTADDLAYSGSAIAAIFDKDEAATWEKETGLNVPAIEYYLEDGATKTTEENSGAENEGKAPANIGTYVAKAKIGNKTALLEYTITKSSSVLTTAPASKSGIIYDGTAHELISAGITADGTLQYKLCADGSYSADIPKATDAGIYTVYYKIAGDNNHNDSSEASVEAKIEKKPITVAGITAENKIYDGTTAAALDYTGVQFDGTVNGEIFDVTAEGSFADKNVGIGKTVNITNIALADKSGNSYLNNYQLATSGNQTTAIADISKKDITVAITSNGGVYGGTITVAAASINGIAVGDMVIPVLTYTGTTNDGADVNSTAAPTSAGAFNVTVSLPASGDGTNYNLTGNVVSDFIVTKASVDAPTIESKEFSGFNLTADVSGNDKYNVTANAGGIAVGSYNVVLTLKDTFNNRWSDSEEADKTLVFRITKKLNSWITQPDIADATYGTAITTSGAAQFGDVGISYVGTGDTTYNSSTAPAKAGTYKATFSVPETSDYEALSTDVAFTIEKKALTVSGTTVKDKIYDGTNVVVVSDAGILSGVIDGDTVVLTAHGTFADQNSGTEKSATITYSLSGDDANNYISPVNNTNLKATISKAEITITAKNQSAYVGDTAPNLVALGKDSYTITGLVNGETLTKEPSVVFGAIPDMTKPGSVEIQVGGAEASQNYMITYVSGTLIISTKSSGGSGGSSSSTVTVPVSGNENSVKVQATVNGSIATVKQIKDADLAKVADGESVSIDLSSAGKNVDTVKIPTQTVEKIAEKSSMTVKLPVAAVEFDNAATEEIVDQAKGSNIELVVDDVKEVSLNAVQKESVKKLDTAIIIDAYLESNGSRLCTADNGGFGGGSAKVILPYEIKNNRKPENYSVFYVNDVGKLEKLNAVYDEELKAFVFEIEHFSVYAVAFEQFVDIDTNAYYYDAVKWAAANGVTDGIDDTHFDPNGITNRAQMVTFLWKAAGRPEPTLTECPFTDVEAGSYYYRAVLWAYENGITDGTTATTFEPDKNVSRAQTVTFLWRYAGKPVLDYWMQMTDVASGQYYTEAVRWALAESITDGTSKTTFSPNDDCLRGQIVTFLYRSLVK